MSRKLANDVFISKQHKMKLFSKWGQEFWVNNRKYMKLQQLTEGILDGICGYS